jgi:hypothetical protein
MDSLPQNSTPVKRRLDLAALLTRALWLAPMNASRWVDFPASFFFANGRDARDRDLAALMAASLAHEVAASGEGVGRLKGRLLWSLATTLKCIASHRRAHGLPRRGFARIGRPVFLGGAR